MHIFDWDNINKIIYLLQNKEILYARNLKLKEVNKEETDNFLNNYHLQNTCKGQDIKLGLYKDNNLVQLMTFGKPRYNKNYDFELLRLCSDPKYKIVGGAEKLFKYFINNYNFKAIISYCDLAKFKGDVYERLGFKLKNKSLPRLHWYNIKTNKHITDNLLRQRGFSQLHNDFSYEKYNKGEDNEKLMLENHYLPVYDCRSIYIYL